MRSVTVNQVIVGHWESWKKWPATEDKDYSDVLMEVWPWRFVYNDLDLELNIDCRFLPAYKCYLDAGISQVVPPYGQINNTVQPDERVQRMQLQNLRGMAKDCPIILWEHAYQCAPDVAAHLPSLFDLAILSFGDDLPSSSPYKTFPVAQHFNALMHTMFVYDFGDGRLVADEYHNRGLPSTYHISSAASNGLPEELAKQGFDIEEKITRVISRTPGLTKFVYVGYGRGNPYRRRILQALNDNDPARGIPGAVKLHGVNMRHGVYGVKDNSPQMGADSFQLYRDAMFGINPQQSSLFNTRLIDLWLCGVAQLIYDPHSELKHYGIMPHEHYIPFDGTFEDLERQMAYYWTHIGEWGDLVRNARAKCDVFTEITSWTGAYKRMYREHLDRILP